MPRRPQPVRAKDGKRVVESRLRVIGGKLRGRSIPYNGDAGLRPMKDRVREAVFNLIGPRVVGKHVVDLFAGTGAMSFEALSRGSAHATLFERKFPNAKLIESAAAVFQLSDRVSVTPGDSFIWAKRIEPTQVPWLIFCCPPYEFYQSRPADLCELLHSLWNSAKAGSLLVVESDERFDPATILPDAQWDIRTYSPAVIGIVEKAAP